MDTLSNKGRNIKCHLQLEVCITSNPCYDSRNKLIVVRRRGETAITFEGAMPIMFISWSLFLFLFINTRSGGHTHDRIC